MIQRSGKNLVPALAALALLFGGSVAIAQQSSSSSTSTQYASKPATHVMTDAEFARSAAAANLAEVKLGNLAEQQGTTQTIKDFGKRMVTDHTQAEDNLKTAAATSNVQRQSADNTGRQGSGRVRPACEIVRRSI